MEKVSEVVIGLPERIDEDLYIPNRLDQMPRRNGVVTFYNEKFGNGDVFTAIGVINNSDEKMLEFLVPGALKEKIIIGYKFQNPFTLDLHYRQVRERVDGVTASDVLKKSLELIRRLRQDTYFCQSVEEIVLTSHSVRVVEWAQENGFVLSDQSKQEILNSAVPTDSGPQNAEYVIVDIEIDYERRTTNTRYIVPRDDYYTELADLDTKRRVDVRRFAVPFRLERPLDLEEG